MGLFRRSGSGHIGDDQQRTAVAGLLAWERAGSLGDRNRVAAQLASSGGWDWWLQLAKQAKSAGDGRLVGQITCFATQSKAILDSVPGMGPLPPDVHRALDVLTVESLSAAPPGLVIQDGQGGLIDAETLVGWARTRLQMNTMQQASPARPPSGVSEITDRQVATALGVAVRLFELSRAAILAELEQAPAIGQDDPEEPLNLDSGVETVLAQDVPMTELVPVEAPGKQGRFGVLKQVGKGAMDHAAVIKDKAAPLAHRAHDAMESDRFQGFAASARDRSQPFTSAAFNVVRGRVYPGHPQWAAVSLVDRADWWSRRLGTVAAATAALPGFAARGTKVDRLVPLLGTAGQVLVVCAVCREGGVDDNATMTQLASLVVLGRQLSAADVESALRSPLVTRPDADFDSVDLSSLKSMGPVGKAVEQARLIRRVSRSLNEVEALLGARQRGGLIARKASGMVGGIGMLATFQAERVGIRKAAVEAARLVEQCA